MRINVDSWGRDVDETFQELELEEISDTIAQVKKRRGPRSAVIGLQFGATLVQIEIRRVTR